MNRRHSLLVVLMVTIAAWCSPMVAFSQELPTFGPLDPGGMPCGLIWLRLGSESAGHLLVSGRPYFVWIAPYKVGQAYRPASWRKFGPWTFAAGRRYTFNDTGMADNIGPTSTDISPALASLHFKNWSTDPGAWFIVNPLPPGCGGSGGGPGDTPPPGGTPAGTGAGGVPGNAGANIFSGLWTGTFHNSLGGSGTTTLNLSVDGDKVTGTLDGDSITNGRRDGQTLRWNLYDPVNKNTYSVEFQLTGEGTGKLTYQVTGSKSYTGYVNDYKRK